MKTVIKRAALFFALTLIFSCSNDNDEALSALLIGETFNHLFFETEQECLDAQPDPDFFINCFQSLEFLDENTAEIVLSDIINRTAYSLNGNRIRIFSSEATEFSTDINFLIVDENTLRNVTNGTIWIKQIGESPFNE